MTLQEFTASLKNQKPPQELSQLLKALWYAGKNDWESAHNIAQEIHSADGSWVHAYLHRQEGDEGNAAYWYRRAGRTLPRVSLDEEWNLIAMTFLA